MRRIRRAVIATALAIAAMLPFACNRGGSSSSPPDFALSTDRATVTIYPSALRTVQVGVSAFGGFVNDVTLSALNLPAGITATFTPPIVLGAQGTSLLTLTSNGSPTLTTVDVTIQGTSGTMTRAAMVALTVTPAPAQRFTLAANPTQVSGTAGGGQVAGISMQPVGGFTGDVGLSLTAPPGISGVFNPTTIGTTSSISTLSLSFDLGLAAGTYQLSVHGMSGSIGDTIVIPVSTSAAPTANGITVQVTDYGATLPGGTTAVRVGLDRAFGVVGSVSLAAAGLPPGIAGTFADDPCPVDGTTLAFNVNSSVAPGLYPVTINATSTMNSGSAGIVLRVANPASQPDAWVSRVEVGQTLFGNAVRLVPDKGALVRVHALADRPGVASPVLRLTATSGATTLGTIALTGPGTMPTSEQPASLSLSYRAALPTAWVKPGLSLLVEIDPANALAERDETNNTATLVPTVSADTTLNLTVVPIVLDSRTGSAPGVTTAMMERWPIKTLNRTVRAPYAVTSVPRVLADGTGWTEVLEEIQQLRANDQSNDFYYGVMDVNYGSGVAGLGYIGFPVSIGRDDDIETAVHELGHNFGLRHANCGGAGGPDVNYPYPGALAGSWGYSPSAGALRSPFTWFDTMGYCGPEWVSDYHYNRVHQFFAPGDGPGVAPRRSASAPQPVTFVHGTIVDGEVRIAPLLRGVGRVPSPLDVDPNAMHWLTLAGDAGTRSIPFAPLAIGCLPTGSAQHFAVAVPDVGRVRALHIDRANRRLLDRVAPATGGLPKRRPSIVESAGRLVVRWDAATHPLATVTHVGERRTTLGLWRRGGNATFDAIALPNGGAIEVQLARGLQTEVVTLPRR